MTLAASSKLNAGGESAHPRLSVIRVRSLSERRDASDETLSGGQRTRVRDRHASTRRSLIATRSHSVAEHGSRRAGAGGCSGAHAHVARPQLRRDPFFGHQRGAGELELLHLTVAATDPFDGLAVTAV